MSLARGLLLLLLCAPLARGADNDPAAALARLQATHDALPFGEARSALAKKLKVLKQEEEARKEKEEDKAYRKLMGLPEQAPDIPDHKGNPIWQFSFVKVKREVWETPGQEHGSMSGAYAWADILDKSGRYEVHFDKDFNGRSLFALHPVYLEPAERDFVPGPKLRQIATDLQSQHKAKKQSEGKKDEL